MEFIVYKGKGKDAWRWRLVARNGKIIADSGEGYSTKANAKRAIEKLRKHAGSASVHVRRET